MSGDSYSAQLNVQKNVGEPHSRTIQSRSLLRINQYCFVPQIDCNIVSGGAEASVMVGPAVGRAKARRDFGHTLLFYGVITPFSIIFINNNNSLK